MEESLKNEIIQWNYEKLIKEVFHHSRAPIHACLGYTELLSILNSESDSSKTEEIEKLTIELRKNLEKVKFQFEILQTWNESNIKKE